MSALDWGVGNATRRATSSSLQALDDVKGWAFGCWVRHPGSAPAGDQVLMGFGTNAAASSAQLRGDSGVSKYAADIRDAVGANIHVGAAYPAANTDTLLVVQYSDTLGFVLLYVIPKGTTVSASQDSTAAALAAITPGTGWYLAGDGTLYTTEPMGEAFVVDRPLTNAELTLLASGKPITAVMTPQLYYPLRSGAVTTEVNRGSAAGANMTLAGTGYVNVAEFFPVDVRETGVSSLVQALRAEEPIPNSALYDVQSWWGPQLGIEKWFTDELVAPSTAVTIATITGNAVADGATAQIDQQRKIATVTGDATANGTTALINQQRVIATVTGNAVADGATATINNARVIQTTIGNAVADGVTATLNQARTIAAGPGNAVADGATAAIDQKRSILTTTGNAVANGATALIDQKRSIATTTGNAVADGVTAVINAARTIQTATGDAVANGVTATINGARTITTIVGDAVADGVTSRIDQQRTIATVVGNAVADGATARIDQARSIPTITGDAIANGVDAVITASGATTITCTPGDATADGVTASIVVTSDQYQPFWATGRQLLDEAEVEMLRDQQRIDAHNAKVIEIVSALFALEVFE